MPDAPDELQRAAADPTTDPAALAEIAQHHEALRPAVALNPAAYDGLLEWLAQFPDPALQSALRQRRGEPEPAPELAPVAAAGSTATAPAAPPANSKKVAIAVVVGVLAVVVIGGVAIGIGVANKNAQVAAEAAYLDSIADDDYVDDEYIEDEYVEPPIDEPEVPAVPPVVGVGTGGTRSWTFASDGGYSFIEDLTVGTPQHYNAANAPTTASGTNTVGFGCAVDATTDLVIPVTWRATVTTVGFDSSIAMRATLTNSSSDVTVTVEQYFSSGTSCKSGTDLSNLNVTWTDPIKPNAAVATEMFVIIEDYYSPARPEGDPAILEQIILRPTGSTHESGTAYNDTGATGWSSAGISLAGTSVK